MEEEPRLTCNTCRIIFAEISEQRQHFKDDLHRFNLKRKSAALPPVDEDTFNAILEKVTMEAKGEASVQLLCNLCSKKYASRSQMDQHLGSNRHKEMMEELGVSAKDDVISVFVENEESDSFDEEDFEKLIDDFVNDPQTLKDCLFCDDSFDSMEANLEHMESHSFFIPMTEYLVDLPGLLGYLATKVKIAYMCLQCPYGDDKGRVFSSVQGCQAHMQDKGHYSFNVLESELEYGPFYDIEQYYEDYSAIEDLKNADIEFKLPGNRIAISRDYIQYYKHPSKERSLILERTEEEKQLIAHQKQIKIQKSKNTKSAAIMKAHRAELKRQFWNNDLGRRRIRQKGAENIHH